MGGEQQILEECQKKKVRRNELGGQKLISWKFSESW